MPQNDDVIDFPKVENFYLRPEETFECEHGIGGITLGDNARAYIRVKDPTGRMITRVWPSTPAGSVFKWAIPYSDFEYLRHGSRYTMFLDPDASSPLSKKVFLQSGLFIWIGR